MITHTQLEYLVAVDRHGSFSEAAARCFVTQPTLSMQIQKLEAELGVSLFDRGRKPVRATTLGLAVIDRAYRTLRELKGLSELVREQREMASGELRVGIIPTLGPYLLPRFIPDFLTSHQQVRLSALPPLHWKKKGFGKRRYSVNRSTHWSPPAIVWLGKKSCPSWSLLRMR